MSVELLSDSSQSHNGLRCLIGKTPTMLGDPGFRQFHTKLQSDPQSGLGHA